MAEELLISPEWFSKLLNEHREISANVRIKAGDLARRHGIELDSSFLPEFKTHRLKKGGRSPVLTDEDVDNYKTVASRFPQRREPSNRADCLAYVLQLLDAAEASGNPDNFPAIMARLKKQFPLDEWDEKPE